jgi:hypothetical protein
MNPITCFIGYLVDTPVFHFIHIHIYPILGVRLKKGHTVFIRVFSVFPLTFNVFPRFSVFSRFISVSGNPHTLERMNYNGFADISVAGNNG